MSIEVFGKIFDEQTRCSHHHGLTDVIAIKFRCCKQYYPCHSCHQESTNHKPEVWARNEFDEKAILCGVCKTELTINEYLKGNNACPYCKAAFNPNCSLHYSLYFDIG